MKTGSKNKVRAHIPPPSIYHHDRVYNIMHTGRKNLCGRILRGRGHNIIISIIIFKLYTRRTQVLHAHYALLGTLYMGEYVECKFLHEK